MIISLHNSQCIQLLLHISFVFNYSFAFDGITSSQMGQNSDFSSLCAKKFTLEGAQTVQVRAKTRFQAGV